MGAQTCWVCGGTGLLVESVIQVPPGGGGGPRLIGQCARCERYVCTAHAELRDLSGKRRWFGRPALVTACCPFDPDQPLGVR